MKKRVYALFMVLMMLVLAGCAQAETPVNVAALKGPTGMGLVKLMDDAEAGAYNFTMASAVDEITPMLVQGTVDIAAVPANLAAVLFNNTAGGVKVLAVNTLGVLYIVENGDTVHSVRDLKGRTIYASGKGATPEYALNYILETNGINPETDVTVEYKSEHAECLAAVTANPEGIALLPQPFVTVAQTKVDTIRIALNLTEEWEKVQATQETPSSLVMGVIVARTAFIDENSEAVSAFLDAYQASVTYVNENVPEAAALVAKYDIVPEAVALKALPYCNIVYIDGEDMVAKLGGYLAVLCQQNPKAVGGSEPDASFYYIR